MQKGESGIAHYGLRVAVDYRYLQADLGGDARWEGYGAMFSGSLLEIIERARGVLVLSGQRSVRVVMAPQAIADVTVQFEGRAPHVCDVYVEVADGADCTMRARHNVKGGVRLHTSVVLGQGSAYHEHTSAEVHEGVFDSLTRVQHLQAKGRSRIATKLVLAEGARAVARGQVIIAKDAVGSRASQRMDALLLGARAEADLLPTMEVATDDVVCNHAATTAQPDADALFYLQSRGLTDADAKRMIAEAFLS